jgi:hypothetical protein
LTLNTNSPDVALGPVFADDVVVEWREDMSLESLLQTQFVRCTRKYSLKAHTKIDPTFTAAYLMNTCGLSLQWTDNIASHLKFDLKRLVLSVYRHKICLVNHLNNQQCSPFPEDLLDEMLDTK